MKLAILGAMVNNAYVMSKVLATAPGYEITYIRDFDDLFLPHQPIWVDQRIYLKSQSLWCNDVNSCRAFDRVHAWQPPDYYRDPLSESAVSTQVDLSHVMSPFVRFIYRRRHDRNIIWEKTLSAIADCDVVLACGSFAAAIARMSGKPYAVWVYGGDIRKMMGLESKPSGWRERIYDEMISSMLRDSYKYARCAGFNYGASIYLSGGVNRQEKSYAMKNVGTIPFPAFYQSSNGYQPQPSPYYAEVDSSLIKIVVPSRIDYGVKGHDKLLAAFARCQNRHRFHLTFTGWGSDKVRFQAEVAAMGMIDRVNILPDMLSRPALFDLLHEADLVVDQLRAGIYGSASLEAMSAGKVPMLYIDPERAGLPELPPVLNCRTEDDILSVLDQIVDGEINLESRGLACQEWAQRYHGNDAFISSIDKAFS